MKEIPLENSEQKQLEFFRINEVIEHVARLLEKRSGQQTFIMLCGVPNSGKTYFYNELKKFIEQNLNLAVATLDNPHQEKYYKHTKNGDVDVLVLNGGADGYFEPPQESLEKIMGGQADINIYIRNDYRTIHLDEVTSLNETAKRDKCELIVFYNHPKTR